MGVCTGFKWGLDPALLLSYSPSNLFVFGVGLGFSQKSIQTGPQMCSTARVRLRVRGFRRKV